MITPPPSGSRRLPPRPPPAPRGRPKEGTSRGHARTTTSRRRPRCCLARLRACVRACAVVLDGPAGSRGHVDGARTRWIGRSVSRACPAGSGQHVTCPGMSRVNNSSIGFSDGGTYAQACVYTERHAGDGQRDRHICPRVVCTTLCGRTRIRSGRRQLPTQMMQWHGRQSQTWISPRSKPDLNNSTIIILHPSIPP